MSKVYLNLPKYLYKDEDSKLELVPVTELLKFREFNRLIEGKYSKEQSFDNIKKLEEVFKNEGITSPLIIEYSVEDNSVLLIEGNHRLNVALELGVRYLPARVVRRNSSFPNIQKSKSMKVSGFEPNQYGYVPADLKPSQVGIQGTKPIINGDESVYMYGGSVYANGGEVLLAPNGKPSNLTPEQYKLVRSDAFISWFGDWIKSPETASKVVDENGEPLVAYHGSNNKFFIFNPNLIGYSSGAKRTRRGVYFSSKKEVAKTFIKKHYWKANFYQGNEIIYEVFLNLRNPNIIDGEGKNIIWLDRDIRDIEWNEVRFKDNSEKGFIIRNTIDTIGDLIEYSDIYIVYNPSDVKLADGTNTTFDANNPDIRFDEGGEVLLSPNGKPSNLTPEQYKLVRSDAFIAWFGDWINSPETASKVVDENGEPLVVYHGTKNRFDVFDINKGGESNTIAKVGFWFSPKKSFAENFAEEAYWGKNDSFVYEVFLAIKNPKIYISDSSTWGDSYEKLKTDIYKVASQTEFDANIGGIGMVLKNEKETINKFRNQINENGYDGIIVEKTRFDRRLAGGINDQYIAFEPTQIKLADGTNVTFDANNPDIRFDEGGEVLLSPNGKPSNLTPEQYKLVRSDAFIAWFGDWINSPETASKMLDDNGEPLVCYHGTNREFTVFRSDVGYAHDLGFYGRGFYFTFNPDSKWMKFAKGEASYYGSIVKDYFIKTLNPFDFSSLSEYKGVKIGYLGTESIVFLNNIALKYPELSEIIKVQQVKWNKETQENDVNYVPISILPELIEKYSKLLTTFETEDNFGEKNKITGYVKSELVEYDYTSSGGTKGSYMSMDTLGTYDKRLNQEEIEILLVVDAIEKYDRIEARYQPEGYMTRYPEITDLIKKEHDGIIQSKFGDEVVVFESTQIKLADGTNVTFDGNNLDVRFKNGGSVSFDKLISASSRFKPTETVVFDPPLEGKNGAKLTSYTWSYEWTMKPSNEGELKSKRVSDWSQAEISAETGRDIVHQYTVLMPDGEYKTVSSDSVPILLGYIDRKELKSFPNLVTASKTLAKQQMQLAILEAQKKEYDDLMAKFEKAEKPEIKEVDETSKFSAAIESWKKGEYSNYAMGDIVYRQDNDYVYETKEYKKRPITKDTIEQLKSFWVLKRVEEAGGKYPRGLYDLKNIVVRQKRKVENILSTKMENGGNIDDFDWESLYNPSPEEEEKIKQEIKKSEEQEKEDWYQSTRFSKKWAATYDEAVNKTVKEYLDAKATYDDWGARQYKQNKGMVFLGGDDVFGEAKSIGSINEGRRQRVLRGAKMQMDEAVETLKELRLTDEQISNLLDNKIKNGGSIEDKIISARKMQLRNKLANVIKTLDYKTVDIHSGKSKEDLFIQRIIDMIYGGYDFKSKLDIERVATKEFGFDDAKKVRELTEYAILFVGRDISKEGEVKDVYEKLVSLYANQPYSTNRTVKSQELGQFSTPAPMAYLMGVYVGINKNQDNKIYFEPTAGNGMLSIAGNPQEFVVNELDFNRYNNLLKDNYKLVLNQDATKPFNFDYKFDGLLANPPFATTKIDKIIDNFKISGLENQIMINALDLLKDNARGAFIVGGHTEFDSAGRIKSAKDKAFLSYLYSRYNVEDVINVSGTLYGRQGTTYPIRIILFNGRKSIPSGYYPLKNDKLSMFEPFSHRVINNFDELYERFKKTLLINQ